MIKEAVLFVCIFGICSAGITYNNVVKPENKQNAIESPSEDLQVAETAQFGYVPNGYGAYFGNGGGYGGYGGGYGGYGGYGGGYGDYGGGYGGGYGGYGGGYGDYGGFGGGCCGGFGYGKK